MKHKLCDVNAAAEQKLPKFTDDKSGIGVHYIDAYVKPMNAQLPDGTAVRVPACLFVTVDGGRITRIEEYADSRATDALRAHAAARRAAREAQG